MAESFKYYVFVPTRFVFKACLDFPSIIDINWSTCARKKKKKNIKHRICKGILTVGTHYLLLDISEGYCSTVLSYFILQFDILPNFLKRIKPIFRGQHGSIVSPVIVKFQTGGNWQTWPFDMLPPALVGWIQPVIERWLRLIQWHDYRQWCIKTQKQYITLLISMQEWKTVN